MRKPRLLLVAALVLGTAFFAQSRVRQLYVNINYSEFYIFRTGEVDEIIVSPYEENNNAKEIDKVDLKSYNNASPRVNSPEPEWETLKIYNDAEEIKSVSLPNKIVGLDFKDDNLVLQSSDATTGNNGVYEEIPYDSFSRIALITGMGSISGVTSSPQDISVMYDEATEQLRIVSSENIHAVRVYNIQGVCVRNADAGEIAESQSISLSGLSSGIYVTEVVNDNGVVTSKIAKR